MSEGERIATNTVRIDNLEDRTDRIEELLEKVRNRLPNYWTFILAGLTGIIGWLVK